MIETLAISNIRHLSEYVILARHLARTLCATTRDKREPLNQVEKSSYRRRRQAKTRTMNQVTS